MHFTNWLSDLMSRVANSRVRHRDRGRQTPSRLSPESVLVQTLEPRLLLTTVDLGVLTTTPQNRSDSVSPGDVDQFHFDLNAASTFTATISGITGGARVNVALIQDLNGNGIVDSGETLETGNNSFSGTSINLSEPLSAGTSYFVQVTSGLSTTGSATTCPDGLFVHGGVKVSPV